MLILYFTCIHSTLVLFGMYGLIKAMSGQIWRFPLIGPKIDAPNSMNKPALCSVTVCYAQMGFFTLFTLTPIFDLFPLRSDRKARLLSHHSSGTSVSTT